MKRKKPIQAGLRKYFIVIGLFVLCLSLLTVFGDKGLVDAIHLTRERDAILTQNRATQVRNSQMQNEIDLLKSDKRYIAGIARKELGLLRADEVIYVTDE
jgi:cell division protein FtsB